MLLGRLDKRAIWCVAGSAVVGCFVMGWIFSCEWTNDQSNSSSLGISERAEIESGPTEDRELVVLVGKTEDSQLEGLVGTVDLAEACPENSENLSDECMRILDSHFLSKPAVHSALVWIDFPNTPTYASIFADPMGDRERVFALLKRSECRLEEGAEIRVDLKESCDAGTIARFSMFLDACHPEGGATNLRDFVIAQGFQRLRIRDIFASDNFEGLDRELTFETKFEKQWKSEKCKSLGFPYVLSQTRNTPQITRLYEIGRRVGFTQTDVPESDYAEVLMLLADRLGAEESVSSLYRPQSNSSTEWDEHVLETRPWLSHWERMMFSYERKPSLLAAIDLAQSLRDIGAEFKLDHLVEMICKGKYGNQPSCQTTLDEIKTAIDWSENEKLHVLDEFETRALELGLYD